MKYHQLYILAVIILVAVVAVIISSVMVSLVVGDAKSGNYSYTNLPTLYDSLRL